MRDQFKGFHRPTKSEIAKAWETAVFAVDANVLLNLYRYPRAIQSDLFAVFETIKNRLFVPHYAALEYERNRVGVISGQKARFSKIHGLLDNVAGDRFENDLKADRHSLIDTEAILAPLREVVKGLKNKLTEIEKDQLEVHQDDPVQQKLDALLHGKVGQALGQEGVNDIVKDGAERFKLELPPGYKDRGKDDVFSYGGVTYQTKFGDLVIWRQLLDAATRNKWESIILITDDAKEDWIHKADGKRLGARPELVEEAYRVAGVKSLIIHDSPQFLKLANDFLKASVSDKTIETVRASAVANNTPVISGQFGSIVERAVFEWLQKRSEDVGSIVETGGPTDYVILMNNGRTIGVEVIATRSPTFAFEKFEAFLPITQDLPFGNIEVVFVLPTPEAAELLVHEVINWRAASSLPKDDVSITVGHLTIGRAFKPLFQRL